MEELRRRAVAPTAARSTFFAPMAVTTRRMCAGGRARRGIAFTGLILALGFVACQGEQDTSSVVEILERRAASRGAYGRPDILLVTIDTLRADHTSTYGYPIPTTPALDALASEGVVYEQMYASSATTGPSHAAIMTGRHARTVGYLKNGHTLQPQFLTLAEVLADNGYDTAAFVSSMPVNNRFGFGQGFAHYDQDASVRMPTKGNGEPRNSRFADETVDRLESWLTRRSDSRPLFVWLHLFDPHSPYIPPSEILEDLDKHLDKHLGKKSKGNLRRYDGEILFTDRELGRAVRLIRASAGQRGALVAVTADHGEGLGEHNWRGHGLNLHQEAVQVPLVISLPRSLPAERSKSPASHIDVAPTILSLVDIERPESWTGLDLTGEIEKSRPVWIQRRAYSSRREKGRKVKGEMIALVQNRMKYIRAPEEQRFELYDLRNDPGELTNLSMDKRTMRIRMEKMVREWLESNPEASVDQPELTEQDKEALRALGYVD